MHQHSDNKQYGPKMDPKWTQHGHNMDTLDPNWTPIGPQMDTEWTQNGHRMDTEWTQNGHRMDPEWTQNGPKMDPQGDTHMSAPGAWHTYKRGSPAISMFAPSWTPSWRSGKNPRLATANAESLATNSCTVLPRPASHQPKLARDHILVAKHQRNDCGSKFRKPRRELPGVHISRTPKNNTQDHNASHSKFGCPQDHPHQSSRSCARLSSYKSAWRFTTMHSTLARDWTWLDSLHIRLPCDTSVQQQRHMVQLGFPSFTYWSGVFRLLDGNLPNLFLCSTRFHARAMNASRGMMPRLNKNAKMVKNLRCQELCVVSFNWKLIAHHVHPMFRIDGLSHQTPLKKTFEALNCQWKTIDKTIQRHVHIWTKGSCFLSSLVLSVLVVVVDPKCPHVHLSQHGNVWDGHRTSILIVHCHFSALQNLPTQGYLVFQKCTKVRTGYMRKSHCYEQHSRRCPRVKINAKTQLIVTHVSVTPWPSMKCITLSSSWQPTHNSALVSREGNQRQIAETSQKLALSFAGP